MRVTTGKLGVVVAVAAIAASCATLGNALAGLSMPRVSVDQVRSLRASIQGLDGEAVLRVDNPNTFPLNLERVGYELTVGGRSAATGETVKPLSVPAGGNTLASIGMRAPLESAVLAGIEFLKSGQVPYALTFTVHFNTRLGAIKVPVTHEGTLRVPHFGGSARNMGVLEDVETAGNARQPAGPAPSTGTHPTQPRAQPEPTAPRGTYRVP